MANIYKQSSFDHDPTKDILLNEFDETEAYIKEILKTYNNGNYVPIYGQLKQDDTESLLPNATAHKWFNNNGVMQNVPNY